MADPGLADLISKMAHELRSPLTSVKGFSSMLTQRWDRFTDEQKLQFVETIHHDAERMSRIVTDILDLARIESGRLELHPGAFELGPALEEAVGFNEALDPDGRAEVKCAPETMAYGDRERIVSVISNLVENALRFSDDGSVVVTGTPAKEGTTILVEDQGVGIEPDRLPGLFDGPGSGSTTSVPSGAGLGLYLAKGIVEGHGGTIEVESTPGKGTAVTVTLPGGGAS